MTDSGMHPVDEAIDSIATWVQDLNVQLPRLLSTLDNPERLVGLLNDVRAERKKLAGLEALLERDVAAVLGTGAKVVGGLSLEVHGGWKRTDWSDSEIARLLIERALLDEATGEIPDEAIVAVARRAAAVILTAGRMTWRVTDLRRAGLDPGEFCKETPQRMTVQILTEAETKT